MTTTKTAEDRPAIPDDIRDAILTGELTACSTIDVLLPGGDVPIHETAARLGTLLDKELTHFVRGGVVVKLARDGALRSIDAAEMSGVFGKVARLMKIMPSAKGPVASPATCSISTASQIMKSEEFTGRLPQLRVISRCAVLVDRGGKLDTVTGYDRASGILAHGRAPDDVPIDRAKKLISDLLVDFDFASASDRSRALAAIISPAFVQAGLLSERVPIDLGEADKSQSGKGYRNRITAAIYGDVPATISQTTGGVGSITEKFDHALQEGETFICFDNIRGRFDSRALESFCTEDTYYARVPHSGNMRIDPRRHVVMYTSNRADTTIDTANRSSIVRIRKRDHDYTFTKYPEGKLLQHVRANQGRYLGAVFSVVRAWYAAGKPQSKTAGHAFEEWSRTFDWIVTNILDAAPLMQGHRQAQERMTTPNLQWLRDLALEVLAQGRTDEMLTATDIVEILAINGTVEIPGVSEDDDLSDEDTSKKARQQTGKRLAQIFKDASPVDIDGATTVERETTKDSSGKDRHRYRFTGAVVETEPAQEPRSGLESLPAAGPPPPPPPSRVFDPGEYSRALATGGSVCLP